MDKNAIKKYAVWARRELIEKVTQKAMQYGIEDGVESDSNLDSINGKLLTEAEKKQRFALIKRISIDGYSQVMEEVAYTWFNRFVALRFMEVNGYLPSHVRVFTDDNNAFHPQIMSEALQLDFSNLDREKVIEMKQSNQDDELYRYLLIAQCNELNGVLPGLFQKISDYSELLLPDYLLREGSVIEQMISGIAQDDWMNQVQIIGWLYQDYNTEPKDIVFAELKKNKKITKEKIPAATQIFTPEWVVKYMVENSLGRLWARHNPEIEVQNEWKYFVPGEGPINAGNKETLGIKPTEIKCIDPCMGSGHILCYMFDVLVMIYEQYGYSSKEAASLIVKNNLFGLDIDERAAQLAYFAVMMKARQYDRRFLQKNIRPHIYGIKESNDYDSEALKYFCNGNPMITDQMSIICSELLNAKTYGSAIRTKEVEFSLLFERINEIENDISIYKTYTEDVLVPLIRVAFVMSQKYDVVITNPPYMGINGMDATLADFCKNNYKDSKSDLCTVMMDRAIEMLKSDGFVSMINMPVWMFISSFEAFREKLLKQSTIINLLHFGRGVFGSDFGSVAFTLKKGNIEDYKGIYYKLYEKQGGVDSLETKERWFLEKKEVYTYTQKGFFDIPGSPISYWINSNVRDAFLNLKKLDDVAEPKQGIATADNNKYLRLWYEVDFDNFARGIGTGEEAETTSKKWYPYSKGGEFRKWYGNNDYVVNWKYNGKEIKSNKKAVVRNSAYHLREGITWTWISISYFGARYQPKGFVFDVAGSMMFSEYDYDVLLAYMCSKVADYFLKIINPTINFSNGVIAKLPINMDFSDEVKQLGRENIQIAREDWDSFETSWDFRRHPLCPEEKKGDVKLEDIFNEWNEKCNYRYSRIKTNEERLNEIFIEQYGLVGVLTPDVPEEEITIRRADRQRDIKSLISYAVGCMFGRYSLSEYGIYIASPNRPVDALNEMIDNDNIIPICDDEYFDDDIVNRFVEFIRIIYGNVYLEDNLRFIADSLSGQGSSRDVIRSYFVNDFYLDHCNVYSVTGSGKRPIYWQFDSGKKNGFKCLIYMHRYQPDTIARIRTDYVHEQQARYRTAIEETTKRIESAAGPDKVKLTKKLNNLKEQNDEIHAYEEKIHHLADQMISIDLDDGVKKNYEIFKDVLAKIK